MYLVLFDFFSPRTELIVVSAIAGSENHALGLDHVLVFGPCSAEY